MTNLLHQQHNNEPCCWPTPSIVRAIATRCCYSRALARVCKLRGKRNHSQAIQLLKYTRIFFKSYSKYYTRCVSGLIYCGLFISVPLHFGLQIIVLWNFLWCNTESAIYISAIMASQSTSPRSPVEFYYPQMDGGEAQRRCTFFDNGKKHYIFMHCLL